MTVARFLHALAVLLLAWQAIASTAHVHAAPASAPAASTHAAAAAASTAPARPDQPGQCPICREVAHSGAYLTPGEILLPTRPANPVAAPVSVHVVEHDGGRSHSWRSRAPPVIALS